MLCTPLNVAYEELCPDFEGLIKERNSMILPKATVHKSNPENVFVSHTKIIESNEDYDIVVTLFHIPADHPYFFEHPKDHIPGLMLIDAGKQAGTAICHTIYSVGLGQVFILDDVIVRFMRLTSLGPPLFGYSHISNKKYRKGHQLTALQAEGYFIQCGRQVAYMKSSWKILDPETFNRIKDK